jgi:hypothetical protein
VGARTLAACGVYFSPAGNRSRSRKVRAPRTDALGARSEGCARRLLLLVCGDRDEPPERVGVVKEKETPEARRPSMLPVLRGSSTALTFWRMCFA